MKIPSLRGRRRLILFSMIPVAVPFLISLAHPIMISNGSHGLFIGRNWTTGEPPLAGVHAIRTSGMKGFTISGGGHSFYMVALVVH